MSDPLVCAFILNWNLKHDTAECLTSVFGSDYPNCRVLVVDNASTDGSPEYLKHHFPDVEIIVNSTNLGVGGGFNVGVGWGLEMKADYVLLLNNDIVVDPSMITQLVACAEADDTIGIVAPKMLYYAERDRIWMLGARRRGWWPVPYRVGFRQKDKGQFSQPFDMDWVPMCAALIRRSVPQSIGLFDPEFVYGFEDLDYCRRARQACFRVICEPRARMWHKVSLSGRKDPPRFTYLRMKSRGICYRRHPYGPAWLTASYLWATTIWRAAGSVLRGDLVLAERAVRGFYDGYCKEPPRPS